MASSKPIRHIRPKQPFSEWLKQLFDRRETLLFFLWKELKVQYRKPILGLGWSVFQPLVYFGIILLVMQVSGRNTGNTSIPFSLYLISGLAVWNFVTSVVLGTINSIQSNAGIISKASFPRFFLVLSPMLKGLLDLCIMLVITFGVALFFGQQVDLSMLIRFPIAILTAVATCLGWSAIAASMVVRTPQIRHAIPIVMYAMLFVLPVFYDVSTLNSTVLSRLYILNPIAGSMDLFRTGFSTGLLPITMVSGWIAQAMLWMMVGVWAFRQVERKLADLL